MGFTDEFFEPIRQGLSDLRSGIQMRDDREYKQAKMAQDEEEIGIKKAKEIRDSAALSNLATAAGKSPMAGDPKLAQALALAGKDIGPAMKPKVTNDTLAYFKLNLAQDYMRTLDQSRDPNADKGLIQSKLDLLDKVMGFTTGHQKTSDNAFKTLQSIKNIYGPDQTKVVENRFYDYWQSTLKPFYKEQGLSDQEIADMEQRGPEGYLKTWGLGTTNPIDAILKTDDKTLNGLESKYSERMAFYDRIGKAPLNELNDLKTKAWSYLDEVEREGLLKAIYLRGMVNDVEKMPWYKIIGPLFGNIPQNLPSYGFISEKISPTVKLRNRLEKRNADIKAGTVKPAQTSMTPDTPIAPARPQIRARIPIGMEEDKSLSPEERKKKQGEILNSVKVPVGKGVFAQ